MSEADQAGNTPERDFVYILWHGDDLGLGAPEAKLLGVYSSEAAAQERIRRTIPKGVPGFADHPDDFRICRYEIDKDEWVEGYVEIDPLA